MSNSTLVDYTRMSPYYTKMTDKKNEKITIHHMAANITVEACGANFQTRGGASNYGIDSDGRVGLYVDESNRAWTSNSVDNDSQAVTIEVANDGGAPDWHVSDKALAKLIDLCVDICQRNGIEYLNYTGDETGDLTMHCWFASTGCPGPYLKSKFPYIANEVNRRLGVTDIVIPDKVGSYDEGDQVKLVTGAKYSNGTSCPDFLFKMNLYIREVSGKYYTISPYKTGSVSGMVHEKYLTPLSGSTTTSTSTTVTKQETAQTVSNALQEGDEISLIPGSKYTTGKAVPNWVLKMKLYCRGITGDTIKFSIFKIGPITGYVDRKYVLKEGQTTVTEEAEKTPAVEETAPSACPYLVNVTGTVNVYAGAGRSYKVKRTITGPGVYTVVKVKNGFGELKAGGWVDVSRVKNV